jgi:hypothetical protein
MIVLVVTREEALGFRGSEVKRRKSDGLAKGPGKRNVALDELPERHHRCAARGFSRHRNRIKS